MLETQKYLLENGLQSLREAFEIEVAESEDLVILNYSICGKNKYHPIVKECRSLCLEKGTWNVVSRAFDRFFNYTECPENDEKFNWNNFVVEEKVDGSLCSVYFYKGQWQVNTRGSFAQGLVDGYNGTWQQLFEEALGYKLEDFSGHEGYSYIFELCSPYTRVVAYHGKPTIYLLSIFNVKDNYELDSLKNLYCHNESFGIPKIFQWKNIDGILKFLNNPDLEFSFEGFVLRDSNNLRIKVKNPKYVAVHHLKGNNNLFLTKNLLPLVLADNQAELDEVCAYFEEIKPKVNKLKEEINIIKRQITERWVRSCNIVSQKDFALNIYDSPFKSILFNARKIGVEPLTLLPEYDKLLLQHLESRNLM